MFWKNKKIFFHYTKPIYILINNFKGPLQCDHCAQGYGNSSIGYCRPCCSTIQLKQKDNNCEDCSNLNNKKYFSSSSPYYPFYLTTTTSSFINSFLTINSLFTTFIFVFIFVLVGILFCWCCYKFIYFCCFKSVDRRADLEYVFENIFIFYIRVSTPKWSTLRYSKIKARDFSGQKYHSNGRNTLMVLKAIFMRLECGGGGRFSILVRAWNW